MQLGKFYVSKSKALRYRPPPNFCGDQSEAHALIYLSRCKITITKLNELNRQIGHIHRPKVKINFMYRKYMK